MMSLLCLLSMLMCATVSPAGAAGPADAVETAGPGSINWTSGEVYAAGIGVPPPNAANPAQARAMAERAAQMVAYRNLLEVVKGVRVDSETVVENVMTTSDIIRTKVDGIVKGARLVKKYYRSDGSVEVLVAMPMKGEFLNIIVPGTFGGTATPPVPTTASQQRPPDSPPPERRPEPAKTEPVRPLPAPVPPKPEAQAEPQQPLPPAQPRPEKKGEPSPPAPAAAPDRTTAQFKGGTATGVVIDGRGLGLRPALLPKIVDPQGREIYVGQLVTRTNAIEQGVAGYAKDVNAAVNNFRVTDNPAVIPGVRATGAARTDVMLSQADAQVLRDLGNHGDFLQYCRVIIVY